MTERLVPVAIQNGWFTRLLSSVLLSQDVILYGMNLPTSFAGLTMTIPIGGAIVSGVEITTDALINEFSPNKDTYVDLGMDGVFAFIEVSNGFIEPALTFNSKRIAKVVTNVTDISAVVDRRFDNIGDYPEVYTADGTLSVKGGVSPTSGGVLSIVGGKCIYFRGQYSVLSSYTSSPLPINSTLHLRISISDANGVIVYSLDTPDGSGDTDIVNDSNKTEFVLAARIVTKGVGSVPVITDLANRRVLSSLIEFEDTLKHCGGRGGDGGHHHRRYNLVDLLRWWFRDRDDVEYELFFIGGIWYYDHEDGVRYPCLNDGTHVWFHSDHDKFHYRDRIAKFTLRTFAVDWARTPFYSLTSLGYATDDHVHLRFGWPHRPRHDWVVKHLRFYLENSSRYNTVLTYRHVHSGKISDFGAVTYQLLAMSKS